MGSQNHVDETFVATVEEVAEHLSEFEGRPVSVHEVRAVEFRALRKLRQKLQERGLSLDDLLPEG